MKKLLQLGFLPRSTDLALLGLRLTFGGGMLWLHGRGKLMDFANLRGNFPDPLGLGSLTSLILAVLAEVVCAALLTVGVFTRLAALGSAVSIGVAFHFVHGDKLTGNGNGELAFLFLAAFVALFLAGGGRYSFDAKLGAQA